MKGRGWLVLALAAYRRRGARIDRGRRLVGRQRGRRPSTARARSRSAIITPLTGGAGLPRPGAAVVDAVRASKTLAKKLGLKVQLVLGDTPVEKGPGEGLVVAQKLIADSRLVGGDRAGDVGRASASASKALFAAGIAHISPSATGTSLTQGSKRRRRRRRSSASSRATTSRARRTRTTWSTSSSAKKVVLIDFQEPYSVGLADAAEAVLKTKGVTTIRQSTSVNTTDFSSLVTRVPSDADIVFFPTQQPPDAQTFGQQLLEQGKRAKVFGGDGANNPAAVQAQRVVRLELRAGHQRHRLVEGADRRLEEGQPEGDARLVRAAGLPRRPQVALEAIKQGVRCGQAARSEPRPRRASGTSRRCGSRTRSSGARSASRRRSNDPLNAKFYIFQIQSNGSYKLVG